MAKKAVKKTNKPAHPNARYKTPEEKAAFTARMKAAKNKSKAPPEPPPPPPKAKRALPKDVVTHNKHVDTHAPEVKEFEAKVAHALSAGVPQQHTMARSYVRNGGPGLGKLRGKTYQATVSFTEGQMGQVVAAAGFRNVSLAEMIRSCVVEHLNKGLSVPIVDE